MYKEITLKEGSAVKIPTGEVGITEQLVRIGKENVYGIRLLCREKLVQYEQDKLVGLGKECKRLILNIEKKLK